MNSIASANSKLLPSSPTTATPPNDAIFNSTSKNKMATLSPSFDSAKVEKVNLNYRDVNGSTDASRQASEHNQKGYWDNDDNLDGSIPDISSIKHLSGHTTQNADQHTQTPASNRSACTNDDNQRRHESFPTPSCANENQTRVTNRLDVKDVHVNLVRTKTCQTSTSPNCDIRAKHLKAVENIYGKSLTCKTSDSGNDKQPTNKRHLISTSCNDLEQQHLEPEQSQHHSSGCQLFPQSPPPKQHQSVNGNGKKASNCYKDHDGAKSIPTKLPATCFKFTRFNAVGQTSIADCMIPKPMGQQVLSLMMLDVGLLPAVAGHDEQKPFDKHHSLPHQHTSKLEPPLSFKLSPNNQQQQSILPHQPPPPPPAGLTHKRSYVRLQSPPRDESDGIHWTSSAKSYLVDNCRSLNSDKPTADVSFNIRGAGQHDYKSQHQPTDNWSQFNHNLAPLQVCLPNHDSLNLKSYSLPSSPRTGHRSLDKASCNEIESYSPIGGTVRVLAAQSLLKPIVDQRSLTNIQSASSTNGLFKEVSTFGRNTISDSADSQSLASSSCSSLNHCPPMLALPDQLKAYKLNQLLRPNIKQAETNTVQHLCNTNSPPDNHDLSCSSEQLTKVERQHELLTVDSNQPIRNVENHSPQIDHVRVHVQENESGCMNIEIVDDGTHEGTKLSEVNYRNKSPQSR